MLLFRRGYVELFRQFIADTLPEMTILTLSSTGYEGVIAARNKFGLDFDDAYQFCVAKENALALMSQDKDFDRVKNEITIRFI